MGRRWSSAPHGACSGHNRLVLAPWDDVCHDPRSNEIYVRGLGLIARREDLDYDDGEPR